MHMTYEAVSVIISRDIRGESPFVPNPIGLKVAFRFRKTGRARFYSHHDLMRHFERGVRRAGLPVRLSQGFNPRPRIVFAHALGLGVASRCEEVAIEFTRPLPLAPLGEKLVPALAQLVEVVDWRKLPPVRKGPTVRASCYRVTGWDDHEKLAGAVAALEAQEEALIERSRPKGTKAVDIRPLIDWMRVEDGMLEVRLWHTSGRSGRIDEICRWLCVRTDDDLASLHMEKTAMDVA